MEDQLRILDIEEDIPLPISSTQALPELTPAEELNMRVRTLKFFADLSGKPFIPDQGNIDDAVIIARAMTQDPGLRPDYSKYPDETMAYLAGLVARSNQSLVKELAEYKNYIITHLVKLIEEADSQKNKLVALTKLGEIDGVDAFKRRSEITHKIIPIEEVEEELLRTLTALEYKVIQDSPMTLPLSVPSDPINQTENP